MFLLTLFCRVLAVVVLKRCFRGEAWKCKCGSPMCYLLHLSYFHDIYTVVFLYLLQLSARGPLVASQFSNKSLLGHSVKVKSLLVICSAILQFPTEAPHVVDQVFF